jgi:predicted RNA polymerase sigma factor
VPQATLERTFRDEWGRVLATLIGFLGDFDLAEEAAQEAFSIAAERWPRDGTPENPRAWLVTTARNRAIDRIRRDRTRAEKIRQSPTRRWPSAWCGQSTRSARRGSRFAFPPRTSSRTGSRPCSRSSI